MAKDIKNTEDTNTGFAFVFGKTNYIIMIAGIVLAFRKKYLWTYVRLLRN